MSLMIADALTFVQNLAPTWVKPQQVMLAQLMCAMAERPSLCTTELARALPEGPHALGPQSLHGRHKRLDRFLSNPRLDEPAIFWRCYRLGVRYGSEVPNAPLLLPILLDTTYFEPFAALVASIPCGGRALPIAFTTYHRRQLAACFPPADRWPDPQTVAVPPARRQHQPLPAGSAEVQRWGSQNHIEEQLLHYVWSFVTASQPVIVADRGFARASLFRWFLGYQRQFVIRFDPETWLLLPSGTAGPVAALMPLCPGERMWLPHVHYGKDDRVPLAVLGVWDVGQAEPWYLATNLTDPATTETCYRWRMRIEAGNRDAKSGVVLRESGDNHRLSSVLHLHRLLLANLCLLWLLALVGLQAQHDLAQPATVAPNLAHASPNDPDPDLLDHGPALPPPVQPHRGNPVPRPLGCGASPCAVRSAMSAAASKSCATPTSPPWCAAPSAGSASTSGISRPFGRHANDATVSRPGGHSRPGSGVLRAAEVRRLLEAVASRQHQWQKARKSGMSHKSHKSHKSQVFDIALK